MAAAQLITAGLTSNEQGWTDCAYLHAKDLDALAYAAGLDPASVAKRGMLAAVGEAVLYVRLLDQALPGKVHVGMFHRMAGSLMVDKPHPVSPYVPPSDFFTLASMAVEMTPINNNNPATIDAQELAQLIQQSFHGHVYKYGQQFAIQYRKGQSDAMNLKLQVKGFEFLDMRTGQKLDEKAQPGDRASRFGQFTRATEVQLSKSAQAPNIKLQGSSSGKANKLFEKGFNFEELGIGGLDKQFKEIFRRAFASRLVPPEILRKMGQNHVRGMLLFGPPGCGKTLIARKIGKALQARPPKIVNGPEILNKYVGQSEENIRALFADAEKEQAEKGDDSELHIIIFDEFDAIAKQRGTTGGGTGVNDSIVNQLLSKIDGVDSLNNVLLIGMTNRKDMIDEAILRPGRLELHVEIGLPDENGREQILAIHTGELRKNGMLAPDVDVKNIAERTKNYTGAECEGLVKAACSYVFSRQIDPADLSKGADFTGVQVNMEDFNRAISETQPAFGVNEEALSQCFANGIIRYGREFDQVYHTLTRLAQQVVHSERTPLVSCLLSGSAGSGKSALAARVAADSNFPFIKRVSGESLLRFAEDGKSNALQRVFNDAYKSPLSLIILDDIERIIEYVAVGPRFSNAVLQTLLVLTKALPPPGHRLMIIGTTSVGEMLEAMEVKSAFQLALEMPMLETEENYAAVLTAGGGMTSADVKSVSKDLAGKTTAIKKLMNVLEMAKQESVGESGKASDSVTAEQFYQSMTEWGL